MTAPWTVSDLAAHLKVTPRFVLDEIVTPVRISYVQAGRKTKRFTTAQVAEFLARNTVSPTVSARPLQLVVEVA